MFRDSFVANLLIFGLGQLAVIGYLSTGMVRRGVALMVVTWILADLALVARFAFGDALSGPPEPIYGLALAAMQTVAVVELLLLASRRVWRRLPHVVAQRDRWFRQAFVHYLRDELEPARDLFRRLARIDPWDLPVRLAHATTVTRCGAPARGRRMLRALPALDRDGSMRDAIETEVARARQARDGVAAIAPQSSVAAPEPGLTDPPAEGAGASAQRGGRPDRVS